ncbi:MAG: hypothetical protein GF346_04920 [Candidatus Eisenbacteria bacterium]|nr:hypothetical protein [Candidatus Latescibacterota bacterium]MBD3301768.1 hypothetical protein [Candidatus Eisenbacteria bacterium]
MAGKNEGGAMIVHTQNQEAYTGTMAPCGATWDTYEPATCEEAITQGDIGSASARQLVWYVAAFHPTSNPGVTVVYFGHNHNFPPGEGWLDAWNFCGPDGTLEVADPGWPEDVNAGNSVAFGSPIVGDHLFPFYWFAAYAFDGAFMGTAINPTGGYAGFVSDDNPGVLDEIDKFGTLRFYVPGENQCPEAPQARGACCFPDGSCEFVTDVECADLGGQYLGDDVACEPDNPCEQPGACCFADGRCEYVLEGDCQGDYFIADEVCDPNPCDQPDPMGACCFFDGSCEYVLEADCMGEYWLEDVPCEPDNPCLPLGACCYGDQMCVVTDEVDCFENQGGYEWYAGDDCDTVECPPVATETRTWGSIKANYR